MLTTTTKRRFTYIGDGSNKFWEIRQPKKTEGGGWIVGVNFGRIGTSGQQYDKFCNGEMSASRYYHKKVQEKLGKGYKEAGNVTVKENVVTYTPSYIPVAPPPCLHDSLSRNGAKWHCTACKKTIEFDKEIAPVAATQVEVEVKVRRFFNITNGDCE